MEHDEAPLPQGENEQLRAWEPPVVEEMDFTATAVAYGDAGGPDLAAYSNFG